MKNKNSKFGLIFTIVCNVVIVLCFVIGFFLFFKIDLPDKLDKKTFVDYMEAKGCKITDVLDEKDYSGMDDYLMTDKESCPYSISYATFNDKKVKEKFFLQRKRDVLQNNPNVRGRNSISVNDFSLQYYEYTTYGDYYKSLVSYSDNSILYASVDKEYREEIIKIFKDFNYKYEINTQGMKIAWYSYYILLFIFIVSMWGTLKKTRNDGWISLIPFYNIGCLSKDVLGSPLWSLLLLVPIGNVVFMLMFYYNLGKVFNKNDSYCVLTMFFPSVCWPLLAFDDSKYTKPKKEKKKL